MASVNKVILIGNVGKDPEIRHLDNGLRKAKFSLATHETSKNKDGEKVEQTEWHNIVILRDGLVEIAERYLQKGKQLYVEGRIRTRNWDDKDGNKKSVTEIIADNFIMLGKRRADTSGENSHETENGGSTEPAIDNPVVPEEPADDLSFK